MNKNLIFQNTNNNVHKDYLQLTERNNAGCINNVGSD